MQYHLDGFTPGDPAVRPAAAGLHLDSSVVEVDVLIVGCGPAGLTLAAQLSAFPEITTRIVEQKHGPLRIRPGRRHRLPDDGDVRGLRFQREGDEGGVLGQRDRHSGSQTEQHPETSSAPTASRTSRTACRSSRT